jgi:hypothetical protein
MNVSELRRKKPQELTVFGVECRVASECGQIIRIVRKNNKTFSFQPKPSQLYLGTIKLYRHAIARESSSVGKSRSEKGEAIFRNISCNDPREEQKRTRRKS